MKGFLYWPQTGHPDILPPKARRMPGRPKKNRRREQGEPGAGVKLGKKGVRMRCSRCLMYGHNKSTCGTSEEECSERQRLAAEEKKAQSEAARAQAVERKKKTTTQKKKQNRESGQGANEGQQPKRKRGRPAKAVNVQVLPPPPPLPPPGVGVYVYKDGTIQMSSQPVEGTSGSNKTAMKK
ncbi:hypothetical protein POM88_018171 [Heracleum sosnowskyi]|uniref:Uncharacterized protein n=1 Tax=Heracleum sosnowskyi TaxID=360622 RepID=A0AAD8IRU1_9APIA|nr:hypothetical protein POM88_018171 [Heracleum sosnowskyi]